MSEAPITEEVGTKDSWFLLISPEFINGALNPLHISGRLSLEAKACAHIAAAWS